MTSPVSLGGEYILAPLKAAPPIGVVTATLAGVTLQQWVLIATLVYTLLQIALLIRKYFKEK